jgi:C_GCAxxG_C_C family probable redox protein
MDERLEAILSENLDLFGAGKINCAEAVLMTLCRYYGEDGDFAPRIATAFGAGFSGRQELCGALSGGLMAVGLRLGRRKPGDDKAGAYGAGKALLKWAEARYPSGR